MSTYVKPFFALALLVPGVCTYLLRWGFTGHQAYAGAVAGVSKRGN